MNCALNTALQTAGKVVVLIPHYNDIAGLNRALVSLSGESVAVIVVDDGSATAPQQRELQQAHPYLNSLHIIYLAENIGKAQALNVGLSYASDYDYIARLDCGDQSLAGRIATQRAFLDSHAQCHLVGSWAENIDPNSGKRYECHYPSDHQDILRAMYRENVFCHSATMFRRETALALGGYPTKYKSAEGYALFFAMAKKYQVANLPQVLARHHAKKAKFSVSEERTRMLSSMRVIAINTIPGYTLTSFRSILSICAQIAIGIDSARVEERFSHPSIMDMGENCANQYPS